MDRRDDAKALLGEARKANAESAAIFDVEGLLLDLNRQPNEALAAFDKADELSELLQSLPGRGERE